MPDVLDSVTVCGNNIKWERCGEVFCKVVELIGELEPEGWL